MSGLCLHGMAMRCYDCMLAHNDAMRAELEGWQMNNCEHCGQIESAKGSCGCVGGLRAENERLRGLVGEMASHLERYLQFDSTAKTLREHQLIDAAGAALGGVK